MASPSSSKVSFRIIAFSKNKPLGSIMYPYVVAS